MKAMSSRDQTWELHIRNLCIYYCISFWDLAEVISSLCSGSYLSRISPLSLDFSETFWKAQNFNRLKLDENLFLLGRIFVRVSGVRSSHDKKLWTFRLVSQYGQKVYFKVPRSTEKCPQIHLFTRKNKFPYHTRSFYFQLCRTETEEQHLCQQLDVESASLSPDSSREKDWAVCTAPQTA